MITIIKPGKKPKKQYLKFRCYKCECEWLEKPKNITIDDARKLANYDNLKNEIEYYKKKYNEVNTILGNIRTYANDLIEALEGATTKIEQNELIAHKKYLDIANGGKLYEI